MARRKSATGLLPAEGCDWGDKRGFTSAVQSDLLGDPVGVGRILP
ncbi:hypothetical protein [Streptomyces sp. NPDC001269]